MMASSSFLRTAAGAICLVLLSASGAAAQQSWQPSPFPDESDKAVMGCSESTNEEAWTCLAVRCEPDGSLALYAELTNLTLDDEFTLVMGGERFAVSGRSREESAPYSNRLDGDVEAIVTAIKGSDVVFIDRPQYPLTPGFDIIPLRGAAELIGALEAQCAASRP